VGLLTQRVYPLLGPISTTAVASDHRRCRHRWGQFLCSGGGRGELLSSKFGAAMTLWPPMIILMPYGFDTTEGMRDCFDARAGESDCFCCFIVVATGELNGLCGLLAGESDWVACCPR